MYRIFIVEDDAAIASTLADKSRCGDMRCGVQSIFRTF